MIILRHWIGILFSISLLAIASALIAEHLFELAPCKMCLKQRHPYYAIIIMIILFCLIRKSQSVWLYLLTHAAILYGLFYALWHVGIEKKILSGPASCSGILNQTNSIESLKQQIENQAVINCSDIAWTIMGLSAATINSLILLFIFTINTIFIFKNFYGTKTSY
jgi:disulfide bond formation protein DsbB